MRGTFLCAWGMRLALRMIRERDGLCFFTTPGEGGLAHLFTAHPHCTDSA